MVKSGAALLKNVIIGSFIRKQENFFRTEV